MWSSLMTENKLLNQFKHQIFNFTMCLYYVNECIYFSIYFGKCRPNRYKSRSNSQLKKMPIWFSIRFTIWQPWTITKWKNPIPYSYPIFYNLAYKLWSTNTRRGRRVPCPTRGHCGGHAKHIWDRTCHVAWPLNLVNFLGGTLEWHGGDMTG